MAQNEFDMAARDILQRIKQTEPKSAERLNLLVQANDPRLLNASRTGANVSITLKPSDIQSPLDDIKVAVFHRKHPQGHPNAGQDDGIGVLGEEVILLKLLFIPFFEKWSRKCWMPA